MKSPWKPTDFSSMYSSVIPAGLKKSVTEWTIWTLMEFSFIAMKSIQSVIERSRWLAWFVDRYLNVASIAVIQLATPYGAVAAASLIPRSQWNFYRERRTVLSQWDTGWLRHRGAAVGKLWGRRRVAWVNFKCGNISVFREEVVDGDDRHGGDFFQL